MSQLPQGGELVEDLLTKADAAKLLGVTPAAVVLLEKRGKLPAFRTAGGMRLFRRADVERAAQERQPARQAAALPAPETEPDAQSSTYRERATQDVQEQPGRELTMARKRKDQVPVENLENTPPIVVHEQAPPVKKPAAEPEPPPRPKTRQEILAERKKRRTRIIKWW
jgi:excisionase family DNA binding protein